mmetsp:Transcript_31143/g.28340  ORF Transcript_31143/g.28340 Transcript_31143/m.28340 type:complete len:89 (+) Transcript_31143:111-377(+)
MENDNTNSESIEQFNKKTLGSDPNSSNQFKNFEEHFEIPKKSHYGMDFHSHKSFHESNYGAHDTDKFGQPFHREGLEDEQDGTSVTGS